MTIMARRILLISGDPTFSYHATRELRVRGAHVETSASLAGAVWLSLHTSIDSGVREAPPESDYSVVELVDRLRDQPGLLDVPIAVCLSDAAMLDAHSMYLVLRGCSVHGRPFNPDGLAAALTTRRAPEPAGALQPRSPIWS
mgnify:CR=1 FL=1